MRNPNLMSLPAEVVPSLKSVLIIQRINLKLNNFPYLKVYFNIQISDLYEEIN